MSANLPITLSRRSVLKSIFFGAAAVSSPQVLISRARAQLSSELPIPSGPLANIPDVEHKTLTAGAIDGVDDEVFAPPGFDVRCVAREGLNPLTGEAAPFGYQWHLDPDGGAVYPSAADGGWVYVSNSEDTPGGVGALRFDADGTLVDAYSILEGTRNNCAGGPTPWGTWLSCEETTGGQIHECDPFGSATTSVRKPALGSFPHEAAAIDPIYHACYMTEDGGNQRFWRFVSDESDLSETDGTTRMGLESGTLQVLTIEGFEDGGYPDDAAAVRSAQPATWETVDIDTSGRVLFPTFQNDETTVGTRFASGEGIWYYEIPEDLRQTPAGGSVPTRGVMFFATKGDNRVWAYDIENELIEVIYDNENMQMETGFNQVDNVVVSPAGDVLVAEDGALMRLVVVVPNGQARLLMQITKGGSEIAGPAFTPDGSRLYFSSQRGPSGADGSGTGGATFEITIPEEYRTRQSIDEPVGETPDNPDSDTSPTGSSGALGAATVAGAGLAALGKRMLQQPSPSGSDDDGEVSR